MPEENIEKKVDEAWKEVAQKEALDSLDKEEEKLSPTDFGSFITSLSLQAMIFLGEIPNPLTNKVEENLNQARFLIDTLLMLREKTKGNLSEEESKALDGFVYELQVRFLAKQKK